MVLYTGNEPDVYPVIYITFMEPPLRVKYVNNVQVHTLLCPHLSLTLWPLPRGGMAYSDLFALTWIARVARPKAWVG